MSTEGPNRALEQGRSMNEQETKDFLAQNGVRSLSLSDFKPGEPILVVFPQGMLGDLGPFYKLPKNKRPSIARLNDPAKLYSTASSDRMLTLENFGGQTDYYAVDPNTKEIVHIKTSNADRSSTKPYIIMRDNIFETIDSLFPKK